MPRIGIRACLLASLLLGAAAGTTLADNGPHSTTSNQSNVFGSELCATCHRAHVASSTSITTSPTEALCFSCHGPTATGATTDVVDGELAGSGRGIRGGGFASALMDTSLTGAAATRPATSAHLVTPGVTGTMWGSGELGSGPGAIDIQLTCLSCHDPHGNGAYRILRQLPSPTATTTPVTVPDEPIKAYSVASPSSRYFGEVYGGGDVAAQLALTAWCAGCHTRIDAPSGSGHTASGDPIFNYRHATESTLDDPSTCTICHARTKTGLGEAADPFGVGPSIAHVPVCQACHVAHGSAAQMGATSSTVLAPGQSRDAGGSSGGSSPSAGTSASPAASAGPSPDATIPPFPAVPLGQSWLLRLDNRGICAGCHDPSGTIRTAEEPFVQPTVAGGGGAGRAATR